MPFAYLKVPLYSVRGDGTDALHRALDHALGASGVGNLLAWGTSLPSPLAREDDPEAFHRVDIGLREGNDLEGLRQALRRLSLADGSALHFTHEGVPMRQLLSGGEWGEATATDAHPRQRLRGRGIGGA